mmetsp:Transcript_9539/g.34949  ORF Transcript_9539/g.34949 Transcript_9539/m.34949 type:complete len:227 (+) Transcript_9539:3603-4283(+)|eukprot:scaffold1970_cov396-Prasinococcus_capsulatus_cf.AAC.21
MRNSWDDFSSCFSLDRHRRLNSRNSSVPSSRLAICSSASDSSRITWAAMPLLPTWSAEPCVPERDRHSMRPFSELGQQATPEAPTEVRTLRLFTAISDVLPSPNTLANTCRRVTSTPAGQSSSTSSPTRARPSRGSSRMQFGHAKSISPDSDALAHGKPVTWQWFAGSSTLPVGFANGTRHSGKSPVSGFISAEVGSGFSSNNSSSPSSSPSATVAAAAASCSWAA